MSDDANLHAEERARDLIDAQLRAAGWEVASLLRPPDRLSSDNEVVEELAEVAL
ncbi:hypothetical protein AAEX63_00095 [Luteococcus sp. H138]|uniref:hypothetical protein n=1 Tax=unclassified Luteococcus TaxID=2639923 RepID=UPI00313A855A